MCNYLGKGFYFQKIFQNGVVACANNGLYVKKWYYTVIVANFWFLCDNKSIASFVNIYTDVDILYSVYNSISAFRTFHGAITLDGLTSQYN